MAIKSFETTIEEIDMGAVAVRGTPIPGLVLIWSCERPMMQPFPLEEGGTLELGRARLVDDDRTSRRHATVHLERGTWRVEDHESRNGTFVDGARVVGEAAPREPRVLRIGRSLFLLERDVRPFQKGVEVSSTIIMGPRLRAAHEAIERAATFGDTLFIHGESGSGKELAARAFHGHGGRETQPFVAVNCAAIPEGLAERLLFGAKKGAFSGATADAVGYVAAADGGTLFLDEVAELDPSVQAKLLRVLESREVMALGESSARRVDVRVCVATHKNLREEVARGRFREDLYFRVGRPEVTLPPLFQRPEEIPWIVTRALEQAAPTFSATASFVEACLLRRWPGNVRELAAEVRRAAQEAQAASRTLIDVQDLPASAGAGFATGGGSPRLDGSPEEQRVAEDATTRPARPGAPGVERRGVLPERAEIEAALKAEGGNVTRAARRLQIHRNQLRRWLDRNQVDPKTYDDGEG